MTASLDWLVTSCIYGFSHMFVSSCFDVYIHAYVENRNANELNQYMIGAGHSSGGRTSELVAERVNWWQFWWQNE